MMPRRGTTFEFVLILISGLVAACGGGTSGSGLNSYEGRVVNQSGAPLEGVRLTIESTGETTETDFQGYFILQSGASDAQIYLLAQRGDFKDRLRVDNVFEGDSRFRIDVTIDSIRQRAAVTNFNMRARMVGLCDYYFENGIFIRQSNRVPGGTTCTLRVELFADGSPLNDARVALEYSSCDAGAQWKLLKEVTTGVEGEDGAAKIRFAYRSAPDFCRYRIVAPYRFATAWPLYYPIETFQENKADR